MGNVKTLRNTEKMEAYQLQTQAALRLVEMTRGSGAASDFREDEKPARKAALKFLKDFLDLRCE